MNKPWSIWTLCLLHRRKYHTSVGWSQSRFMVPHVSRPLDGTWHSFYLSWVSSLSCCPHRQFQTFTLVLRPLTCLHSMTDGPSSCFWLCIISNKCTENLCAHRKISLGATSRSRKYVFLLLVDSANLPFKKSYTRSHSYNRVRTQLFPQPNQHGYHQFKKIFLKLMGENWFLVLFVFTLLLLQFDYVSVCFICLLFFHLWIPVPFLSPFSCWVVCLSYDLKWSSYILHIPPLYVWHITNIYIPQIFSLLALSFKDLVFCNKSIKIFYYF